MPLKTHNNRWQRPLTWFALCIAMLATLGSSCTFNRLQDLRAPSRFVGRLALFQDADPSIAGSKADSWSAHFELAGTPSTGTLLLYTPVGTVVAKVSWQPDLATVETSEETQTYSSLDELTTTYFQQTVPVAALFDWLKGQPTQQAVPGWDVNLTQAAQGIINAERLTPAPRIRLRAAVDEYEENLQNDAHVQEATPVETKS